MADFNIDRRMQNILDCSVFSGMIDKPTGIK